MKIPLSVWLSAAVLLSYGGYGFYRDPLAWLQCFFIVILGAAFVRVAYWFIEGE